MTPAADLLVQADFDGTITLRDVSLLLLDRFGPAGWRRLLGDYRAGRIRVEEFMARAFAGVRAGRDALVDHALRETRVRRGFGGLAAWCGAAGVPLVIVSNGLEFYIRALLEREGVRDVEAHAARAEFTPDGIEVRYAGPGGAPLRAGLKEDYLELHRARARRVAYIGNGDSDRAPALRADRAFATGALLDWCRRTGAACRAFEDFDGVRSELERWRRTGA